VFKSTTPITSAANEAQVNAVLDAVSGMRFIVSVTTPFDPKAPGQISADGKVAFATLQFDRSSSKLTKSNVKPILDKILSFSKPGFEVVAGGAPIEQAETPVLGSTEGVGIFAAIIILLFAFGSVIAMGLPIVTALFGIAVGVGVIDLFSHLTVVPTFATELAAMIGIGVGIDYALFIVTRYRQGLNDGFDPRQAVILALSTSGRAVLFAGSTVVISLLGMLLLGLPFVYGLAFGAIAAVLLVMAGSLTLLPALLGFSGHAIDRLRVPNLLHRGPTSHRESFWWRWSRLIQRVPWIAAAVSLAVLVVLAIPLFSMKLGFTDAGNDQTNLSTRKAFDILAQSFGPGANGPLVIAVQLPAGAAPASRPGSPPPRSRLRASPTRRRLSSTSRATPPSSR
jgi:RND superfamily putative drug exporter